MRFEGGEGMFAGEVFDPGVANVDTCTEFSCRSVCDETGHVCCNSTSVDSIRVSLNFHLCSLSIASFYGLEDESSLLAK